MENYFKFNDGEYISGWRYWTRQLLQSLLIFAFGLGLYLIAVTAYKRALSLGDTKNYAVFIAIWISLVAPVLLVASNMGGPIAPLLWVIANVPHWILWFSNGKKPVSAGDTQK